MVENEAGIPERLLSCLEKTCIWTSMGNVILSWCGKFEVTAVEWRG